MIRIIKWLLFSTSGRANIPQMWLTLLFYFAALVPASLATPLLPEPVVFVPLLATLAILFYVKVMVGIKRCHDLGYSGWLLLLGFVPVANLYLLSLYLWPGKKEINQYGARPLWISVPTSTEGPAPIQEIQPEIA